MTEQPSAQSACQVCRGESLGATIGPDGTLIPRACGACGDVVVLDPTDPQMWGAAVDRVAKKMAERMWGPAHWYQRVANDALTAAFPCLDPKDTQRACRVYMDPQEATASDVERGRGPDRWEDM